MGFASISIREFRDRLKINKHDLDTELEIHAQSQERIGREVESLNTEMLKAKRYLDEVEARLIEEIKARDTKLSNPLAEKEVKRQKDWKDAWDEYHELRQEHGEWSRLLEAWSTRGYNLKTLADLHGQQYYTVDSTTDARQRLRDAVGSVTSADGRPLRRRA